MSYLDKTHQLTEDAKAWIGSILLHVLVLFLLTFTLVWKPQIPPPVEYGIEVNFGTDDQGFGEDQSFDNSGTTPNRTVPTPSENAVPEPEQKQDAGSEQLLTSQDEEAPAVLPVTKKEEPKENPAPETKVSKGNPTPQALFPSENPAPASNNNGNKPGTTGDMGRPDGNPDARGIYEGNPGKGKGGSSLDMAGWRWDKKPVINDESDEEGKIVFQVKVDEDGSIIAVNVLEKSVSPALVKKYQREVEELTFSKISGNSNSSGATGRITFIITSR